MNFLGSVFWVWILLYPEVYTADCVVHYPHLSNCSTSVQYSFNVKYFTNIPSVEYAQWPVNFFNIAILFQTFHVLTVNTIKCLKFE